MLGMIVLGIFGISIRTQGNWSWFNIPITFANYTFWDRTYLAADAYTGAKWWLMIIIRLLPMSTPMSIEIQKYEFVFFEYIIEVVTGDDEDAIVFNHLLCYGKWEQGNSKKVFH